MVKTKSKLPAPGRFQKFVEDIARLIRAADNIAALTGAGISTKAGIPDFRGPQGLYITKKYDTDQIFDIFYFYRDPKPFYEFARDFVRLEETIQPTAAHRFFAGLKKIPRPSASSFLLCCIGKEFSSSIRVYTFLCCEKTGRLKGIITQNIDSLHQMAGSKNVLEMHGSFRLSHCLECRREFSYEQMKEKLAEEEIPRCSCGGVLKPDIVFFGENVKCLQESMGIASQADLFFVVGTSCVVYPAAMIPDYVKGSIVIVNRDPVQTGRGNVVLEIREDIDGFFGKVSNHIVFS